MIGTLRLTRNTTKFNHTKPIYEVLRPLSDNLIFLMLLVFTSENDESIFHKKRYGFFPISTFMKHDKRLLQLYKSKLEIVFLSFSIAHQSSKNFHFLSQLGMNFILERDFFLFFYLKKVRLNLIHVRFRETKMNLFSPSRLGAKISFLPPSS